MATFAYICITGHAGTGTGNVDSVHQGGGASGVAAIPALRGNACHRGADPAAAPAAASAAAAARERGAGAGQS